MQMNLDLLAAAALGLAAVPAGLFALNLPVYRPLPVEGGEGEFQLGTREDAGVATGPRHSRVSVLIPARDEEQNLRATLEAVLANHEGDFEVIVLDDHSTDGTAALVNGIAAKDPRVRLVSAPPLPAGWCGKQHACHVLARLARNPLLVFMDADVRLEPDALARMASFMKRTDLALASGIPRQELGTMSERLLIPLVHFILLGFLPMQAMRRTRWPAMSAGCGQLFVARRDAYERCGGHSMLRGSLHDGLKLPRTFRRAGFATDLFDATDLATCRMYRSNADTWRGLHRNSTEGLAASGTILPMTVLLFGGQVLPFILLALAPMLSVSALVFAGMGVSLAYMPRLMASRIFRQPLDGAWLHPVGVLALLAIQWHAFAGHLAGKPSRWKGRNYPVAVTVKTL